MADITLNALTLIELAKRSNNKDILTISEVLAKSNQFLEDAVWVEANQPTSHVHSRRLALPTGTWRLLNQGVSQEASRTRQIVEEIAMLEAYSTIDAKLVALARDKAKFRSTEDVAFLEGLSQTLADCLVYGNRTDNPEKFNGFFQRYATLANDTAGTNLTTRGASGTGTDVTSVLLVQWGEDKAHMIYPSGSMTMGIKKEDLGIQTVLDSSNNPYQAYRTHFTVDAGLVVRDDRAVGRLANIESTGSANQWTANLMVEILNQMLYRGEGAVAYVNKTVMTQMDKVAMNANNVDYSVREVFGRPVVQFRGTPIKLMETIRNNESAIS